MWFELLILVIGVLYGYFTPGKEDRWGLLKKGIIIGIVLGVIIAILSLFLAPFLGGLAIFIGLAGAFGVFIEVVILVIIFIIGTFIGDWLEGMKK